MLASARMMGSTLMCILNYHRWAALLNRHYCKWMVCCIMYYAKPYSFLVGIQPKADGTMQASSPTNISQVVRTEADYWAIVQ